MSDIAYVLGQITTSSFLYCLASWIRLKFSLQFKRIWKRFTQLIKILIQTKVLMLLPIQLQDTTNLSHIIHQLQPMDTLNPLMVIQSQLMDIQNQPQPMELQNQNMAILNLDMDHQSLIFQKNQYCWLKDHMKLKRFAQ